MQFLYLFHYERQFEFKIYGAVACSWCSEVKIELPHDCFACHNFCYRISIRHSDLWTKGKLKTNDNLLWKNDCEKRYWNGKCLVNPIQFARKIKMKLPCNCVSSISNWCVIQCSPFPNGRARDHFFYSGERKNHYRISPVQLICSVYNCST